MSASLSDILTTQKNGVVALGNLVNQFNGIYNNIPTLQLAQANLTNAVATYYTAPTAQNSHVNCINICNTTNSTLYVYIFIVPPGSTAGTGNAIFYNAYVPAATTILWTGAAIILSGGTLQAYASASGLCMTVSEIGRAHV